jgi:hypothetical protein
MGATHWFKGVIYIRTMGCTHPMRAVNAKKEMSTLQRRRYFCRLLGAVGENLFELRHWFSFQCRFQRVFSPRLSIKTGGSKNSGDKKTK